MEFHWLHGCWTPDVRLLTLYKIIYIVHRHYREDTFLNRCVSAYTGFLTMRLRGISTLQSRLTSDYTVQVLSVPINFLTIYFHSFVNSIFTDFIPHNIFYTFKWQSWSKERAPVVHQWVASSNPRHRRISSYIETSVVPFCSTWSNDPIASIRYQGWVQEQNNVVEHSIQMADWWLQLRVFLDEYTVKPSNARAVYNQDFETPYRARQRSGFELQPKHIIY